MLRSTVGTSACAVLLAAAVGCGSASRVKPSQRAVEVAYRCVDMNQGQTMGAAIVQGTTSSGARYTRFQYDMSRGDARSLARRLNARFSVEC